MSKRTTGVLLTAASALILLAGCSLLNPSANAVSDGSESFIVDDGQAGDEAACNYFTLSVGAIADLKFDESKPAAQRALQWVDSLSDSISIAKKKADDPQLEKMLQDLGTNTKKLHTYLEDNKTSNDIDSLTSYSVLTDYVISDISPIETFCQTNGQPTS